MKAHIEYLKYVLRHKWFVFWACLRLGVPFYIALIHDWTKFTPQEWGPYVRNFFNPDGSRRSVRDKTGAYNPVEQGEAFLMAWQHHESHNKHHWGYWLTFEMSNNERYWIQSHGDGYPLMIWDNVEKTHVVYDIPDDWSVFVGGKDVSYKLLKNICNLMNRDSKIVALPIPEVYAREMVADWVGAGTAISGTANPVKWYAANKEKMILHPKTREFIERLLNETF